MRRLTRRSIGGSIFGGEEKCSLMEKGGNSQLGWPSGVKKKQVQRRISEKGQRRGRREKIRESHKKRSKWRKKGEGGLRREKIPGVADEGTMLGW